MSPGFTHFFQLADGWMADSIFGSCGWYPRIIKRAVKEKADLVGVYPI